MTLIQAFMIENWLEKRAMVDYILEKLLKRGEINFEQAITIHHAIILNG